MAASAHRPSAIDHSPSAPPLTITNRQWTIPTTSQFAICIFQFAIILLSLDPRPSTLDAHSMPRSLALLAVLALSLPAAAADKSPVRMGSGIMTFDTVPGWGLDENGRSVLGPTHGGVAVG